MRRVYSFSALSFCLAAAPAIGCPVFPPPDVQGPGGPAGWTVMDRLERVPPPTTHVQIPEGPLQSVTITLRRDACYGDCPVYTVTIRGDGTSRYHGEAYVLVPGDHMAKIGAEDVRCLLKDFYAADFWSSPASYRAPITDNATYTVTLAVGGKSKAVEDYVGAAVGMPKEVTGLETVIDQLAGNQWAIGNEKTVPALKREGFNFVSSDGAAMLAWAVRESPDQVVLDLLAAGAPIAFQAPKPKRRDRDGVRRPSLVENASRRDTTVVLRALIDKGAFNRAGAKERALIAASNAGRVEAVREVLKHRPDVNFRDPEDGATALIEAGSNDAGSADGKLRQVEIIRVLLAAGADPKAHRKDGWTALHDAMSTEAMKLLLDAGADVNARDDDGDTRLSWADNDDEAVFLLEHGADPHVRAQAGGSFSDMAAKRRWVRTLAWLKAHQYGRALTP